ncbi:MAG: hypothetical protein PVJ43_11190 [Gemmatimonadales bacterium]|jgi:hypothetical protein
MRLQAGAVIFGSLMVALPLAEAGGQERADSTRANGEALRVFMDCRSRYCDFDHFRREISFVDYVRDRRDAHVHVLVTTRRTGSGGEEFSVAYIGQRQFESIDDSLQYFSSDTDTFDEIRSGLTRTLKLGLVRYVARLPLAERIEITYVPRDSLESTPQAVDDPWNFWIFRIRLGGDLGGEERQRGFSGNGSLSANRTTEEWKIRLGVSGWYESDDFELSDGEELTSIARNYGGGATVIKSLGEHWSAGATAEARTSTYQNQDLRLEAGPAVEFNVFPYSESTRREFTFVYAISVNYYDYETITIFDRNSETRPSQFMEISYTVRQPFGTVNVSLDGSNFLDDFDQHRIDLRGYLNVRLVRGLELNLRGSFSRIKDQIYLPREDATDDEVLLRRRELGTDYRYGLNISLSYTFGSIYNNIVNPRFR